LKEQRGKYRGSGTNVFLQSISGSNMYIKVHVLDVISCVYGKEMKETTEEA